MESVSDDEPRLSEPHSSSRRASLIWEEGGGGGVRGRRGLNQLGRWFFQYRASVELWRQRRLLRTAAMTDRIIIRRIIIWRLVCCV